MSASPIRLLLLEDNPGDARLVQAALAEHHAGEFVVVVAERLSVAEEFLRAQHFDVVLTDLGLPDSTDLGAVKAIAALPNRPPLVVLTGSMDDDKGRAAIRNGAQDYLVKGEASGALIARTLRYAIERKRLEDGLRTANEDLERRIAERTADLKRLLAEAAEARSALLGVMEDVEREAQERQRSEERFRRLVEKSPDILYRHSRRRGSLYLSERADEILGYPREHLYAHPFLWQESIHPDDRESVEQALQQIETTGKGFDIEYRLRDARGEWVWMHDRSIGMTQEEGDRVLEGLAGDVSQRRRDQDQISAYVEQLRTAFMHAVEVATNLSEMRDPYTAGHERRVAEIAVAIGGEMGLDERRVEGLRVAGYLHDVGKISIPTEILSKPGRLTEVEMSLIRNHAEAGYEVLKRVDFPWPVAQVALQHHERLDGSGYPRGLKGEEILLEARILAVADVVEAMSSHRPYRPGLGIDRALAEIERGSGSVYDPVAAAACLRLFREKGFALAD